MQIKKNFYGQCYTFRTIGEPYILGDSCLWCAIITFCDNTCDIGKFVFLKWFYTGNDPEIRLEMCEETGKHDGELCTSDFVNPFDELPDDFDFIEFVI